MPGYLPVHPIARVLLLLILVAGVYFFHGFLVPVLAALIIGFASWPLYERWLAVCRGNDLLASSVALTVIILVLVAPLSIALYYSIREASQFVGWLLVANRDGVGVPAWITALPFVGDTLSEYWKEYLGVPHGLEFLVQTFSGKHLGDIDRKSVV